MALRSEKFTLINRSNITISKHANSKPVGDEVSQDHEAKA